MDSIGHPASAARYRFQWTAPIALSPHDPEVLYFAANVVFRSLDRGQSWEVISPDLTRDDPEKQKPSGGAITRDNVGSEYYNTIFDFARTVTLQAHQVTDEQVENLRDIGFSDGQIFEAAWDAAAFAYLTRIVEVAGIRWNPPPTKTD